MICTGRFRVPLISLSRRKGPGGTCRLRVLTANQSIASLLFDILGLLSTARQTHRAAATAVRILVESFVLNHDIQPILRPDSPQSRVTDTSTDSIECACLGLMLSYSNVHIFACQARSPDHEHLQIVYKAGVLG